MSSKSRRFQVHLATSLFGVLALVVFLFIIALLVSVPLLQGISDKSEVTRKQLLPELVSAQRNALKTEKIYAYLQAIYRAQNALDERNLRLEAQVLTQSFAFESDQVLLEETTALLASMREMIRLRQEQRQLKHLSENLFPEPLSRAELATQLLFSQLQAYPISEVRSERLHQLFSTELRQSSPLWPEISDYVQQIAALNDQVDQIYREALQRQEQLASYLSSDAALKTQELALEIRNDVERLGRYIVYFILIAACVAGVLLLVFRHAVQFPIETLVRGLKAIRPDSPVGVELQPVFFKELDTIRHAIEDYSQMTRDLHQLNAQLHALSQQDGLTGLANRRCFDTTLAEEFHRALRHGQTLSLLLIDIDHFKQLNDTYGHLIGDLCLKRLAEVLQHYTQRAGELAARFGGEEFTLILPQMGLQQVLEMAERIRLEVSELNFDEVNRAYPDLPPLEMQVSIGVAHYLPGDHLDQESFFIQADKALYRAKAEGRNRVCEGV
ncbi:GGDEF domain-containing protein [Nitrincola tapanii]|uniref:diguanylate cyclase n=1 Tax=Nitrincola tapanii TaxID=1708751 RepID=A0A5A9VZ09_9GAMM|nr:GGDEF domain-containing protein [Nitrincola tapanii]KAA0873633.1 GGDEF domain-containing protein [Nitrincola tapanii]